MASHDTISSIRNRFPKIRLLTLICSSAAEATPALIFELASILSLNGANLWNEFMSYKAFACSLNPLTANHALN